jgi:hypothetical protein
MCRCKAPEIIRNKAYLEGTSLTKDDMSGVALAKAGFYSACYSANELIRRIKAFSRP